MSLLRGKHCSLFLAAVLFCLTVTGCPSPLPEVLVPDFVGMNRYVAQAGITTAGLQLGLVSNEFSATIVAGGIVRQEPAAGARVAAGSSVNLVVSKGPEVVTFADLVLDVIIRRAIGKESGDIYSNELVGLVILDEVDRGIEDLSGLEHCINLEVVSLQLNGISDLTPLGRLSHLETLWLAANQISDLSPLSGLTNLRRLDVRSNQIDDVSALASLPNLEWLRLDSNPIGDLGSLAGLRHLQNLSVNYAEVDDLTPLAGLVNLQYVSLNYNQISDLSPLAGLAGLVSAGLAWNQIADLEPLAGLTGLEWLGLTGNLISDLTPLSGLTNLDALLLGANQIANLSPLVSNMGLGIGEDDYVYLSDNPLDQEALCIEIPALELRLVTVYHHGTCETE